MKDDVKEKTMKEVVEELGHSIIPIKVGDTVEVTILSKSKNRIMVDLNGFCYGMIPEKEFSTEIIDSKTGDKIMASLIDLENDEGYAVLSLRRADKEKVWQTLKEKMEKNEPVKVKVQEANRGGLIVQYGSIEGFVPISQLGQNFSSYKNNQSQIGRELKKMVDSVLEVKVINFDKENNKLIFSEKQIKQKDQIEKIKKLYKIGEKAKGKITAIVPFGLFIDLGEIEGLVHISEISWDKVSNLAKMYQAGQEIDVQVIDLENGKVSLSIKRLSEDPWLKAIKKYKENNIIEGKVTKITPFGAFVEIDNKITGLVHVSEFQKDHKTEKFEEVLSIGNKYKFKILSIEPTSHKINLTLEEVKKSK